MSGHNRRPQLVSPTFRKQSRPPAAPFFSTKGHPREVIRLQRFRSPPIANTVKVRLFLNSVSLAQAGPPPLEPPPFFGQSPPVTFPPARPPSISACIPRAHPSPFTVEQVTGKLLSLVYICKDSSLVYICKDSSHAALSIFARLQPCSLVYICKVSSLVYFCIRLRDTGWHNNPSTTLLRAITISSIKFGHTSSPFAVLLLGAREGL